MHKIPKYSFKNNLFFSISGGVNIRHQVTQVYPNHHAKQPIVLTMTQCVEHHTLFWVGGSDQIWKIPNFFLFIPSLIWSSNIRKVWTKLR